MTSTVMKHLRLQVLTDDLQQVSLSLAKLGLFDPDVRSVSARDFPTIPGEDYRALFAQASARMDKVRRLVALPGLPEIQAARVIERSELSRINDWLGEVWNTGSAYEERFRRFSNEERAIDQLEAVLANFATLKIDLSLLQGDKRFINLFVGSVPNENEARLKEALQISHHLLFTFLKQDGNANVVIIGPRDTHADELQSVLQAADFRPMHIPRELHKEPDKVREDLAEQRRHINEHRVAIHERFEVWIGSIRDELLSAQRVLALAEPFVNLDQAMRNAGQLGVVTGWAPAARIPELEQELERSLKGPFLLTVRRPQADERPLVPTVFTRSRLLAPFQTLVRQYGVPRYGEFDPTWLFAISFVLMFGMMFGDVGHGLVFVGAAWWFRDLLKQFTPFVIAAGISSTLFGFLYGSIFGYEELIPHLWVSPLHEPLYMLTLALFWGIGFIVLISLIAIYNRLATENYIAAIFDNNGVLTLAFYLALVVGGHGVYENGEFGLSAAVIVALSLGLLAIYRWKHIKASIGERALVVFIETFETLTSYVSNTLSFLRVAAFSLNHVALAIAVFTLAEMMDITGHIITLILGNVFILVLEGGIVIIQTLRLEYYEGFSRFFYGDGREFQPLQLRGSKLAKTEN